MLRLAMLFNAHRPRGRLALSVAGIALGVALGYAVHLVNRAAVEDVAAAVRSVAGEADIEVRGGRSGFPEALYPRIAYRVAPAENSGINSGAIDLITIAQALHWFDLDRFYPEAKQVLKPPGLIAAWASNLLSISPAINAIVNHYYSNVVGSFWPAERELVEKFDQLPFPFSEIRTPSFEIRTDWNLDQLVGYLRTWSATQGFITANKYDPLESIVEELRSAWDVPVQRRQIVWPLTLRVGHA